MDTRRFERTSAFRWLLPATGPMRVPAILFADEELLGGMDDKVGEQLSNVATLPGIVEAALAMPDAHWGYGFPIGGVAAFDPEEGGIVSAGGVGFDISCGVRSLLTGLQRRDIEAVAEKLAHELARQIPAGLGSTGHIRLEDAEFDRMLRGGARWAVERGWGSSEDLEHCEERGCIDGADPAQISRQARRRQRDEMGTLGSGNHYLEIQAVADVFDPAAAAAYGLAPGAVVVSIHCGSRGLGHQIGTEFLREMAVQAPSLGITLPDRELACAPIRSDLGQRYLGAMRSAMNCALANRQILTELTRQSFARQLPAARLTVMYDVSHNICKEEEHELRGIRRKLFVHRKGATRAFGPGNDAVPPAYRGVGQPVLIGGSLGTSSWVLAGTSDGEAAAFSSACHGAGRAMSRHQATRRWQGREIVRNMAERGIIVKSPSMRGVAEEAPGAYKDVERVVEVAHVAGLARKVARLEPIICIKG
jgi:tRNA-splicing ligase RtcB